MVFPVRPGPPGPPDRFQMTPDWPHRGEGETQWIYEEGRFAAR